MNRREIRWHWEEWACKPHVLQHASANYLLTSMYRNVPFAETQASLIAMVGVAAVLVLCLICDSASANFSSCQFVAATVRAGGKAVRLALHVEPCGTHQVHLVKAYSIDRVGTAGILHALSSLMRWHGFLGALRSAIGLGVAKRVDVSHQPRSAALTRELYSVLVTIFTIDGDESMLYIVDARTGMKKPTKLHSMIENVSNTCHFNKATQRWIVYAGEWDTLETAMTDGPRMIAMTLQDFLTVRAWPRPALSRWTGVMATKKKALTGVALNVILAEALA